MTLVRHAGALEVPERAACNHHSVSQKGGVEETAVGKRGDAGDHVEGLLGLWQASRDGHTFQITGEGLDRVR